MDDLLTSHEVCAVAGISYRQLDYWLRRGYVRSAVAAKGSGSRRGFGLEDLAMIEAVQALRAAGAPQQILDRVTARLHRLDVIPESMIVTADGEICSPFTALDVEQQSSYAWIVNVRSTQALKLAAVEVARRRRYSNDDEQ